MVLWSGKWLISAMTYAAAAAFAAIALMLPIFTRQVSLAPAEQSGGGMSALMQQRSLQVWLVYSPVETMVHARSLACIS